MMPVADRVKYQRHRGAREGRSWRQTAAHEFWLPVLLFGSMGAITWAIRGTDGWGGVDGTIVPGMTYGLLWYYLCQRKGIDARNIPMWLGTGIALGGSLGYGQYVSWIRGQFAVGDSTMPVAPWIGYLWFAICGIGWGAPGGILLGWGLAGKASARRWLARLAVPLGFGILGWLLVKAWPSLFFPHYDLGLYSGELDRHLLRTVETNTTNFEVVAWWVGAMLVAALQRDRATLMAGAVIGGGFGIGFPLSALWCLGYTCAPNCIDWWKMWELNAGFNLGLLYVIVLRWAIRRTDDAHMPDGTPAPGAPESLVHPEAQARRRSLSLVSATWLLLMVMAFGATYNAGVLLEFYDKKSVGQYAWPGSRAALFVPIAVVLTVWAAYRIRQIAQLSRDSASSGFEAPRLPERMADLIMIIGMVGAVSIWPSEIGILYVVFLALAIHAFSRMNRRLDAVDTGLLPASSGGPRTGRRP